MKKRGFILILSVILLLSACSKAPQQETPASSVQQEIEKEDLGNLVARVGGGDFYCRIADGKTVVTYKTQTQTTELKQLDGAWRFSMVEETADSAHVIFDGYKETAQGYEGYVFMYVKQTGNFAQVFDEETSNAVILPTADAEYADLAWVLVRRETDCILCPIQLRDGGTEMGQIVALDETDYTAEQENLLVSLRTDASEPLKLTIENRVYSNGSVLVAETYVYDFEAKELIKTEEEE